MLVASKCLNYMFCIAVVVVLFTKLGEITGRTLEGIFLDLTVVCVCSTVFRAALF